MNHPVRKGRSSLLMALLLISTASASAAWWGGGYDERGWEARQQGWEGEIGWGDDPAGAPWGSAGDPYAGGYGPNAAHGYYDGGSIPPVDYGAGSGNRAPVGWMPPPYGPYQPSMPYPLTDTVPDMPSSTLSPGGSH